MNASSMHSVTAYDAYLAWLQCIIKARKPFELAPALSMVWSSRVNMNTILKNIYLSI